MTGYHTTSSPNTSFNFSVPSYSINDQEEVSPLFLEIDIAITFLVAAIGTCANLAVIGIFIKFKSVRNVNSTCACLLSAGDLLRSSIIMLTKTYTLVSNTELHGIYCLFTGFISSFTFVYSPMLLAVIALCRYLAISKYAQLDYIMSKKFVWRVCSLIFIVSVLFSSLPLWGVGNYEYSKHHGVCFTDWKPDNRVFRSLFYTISVGFTFPFLIFCYVQIFRTIHHHEKEFAKSGRRYRRKDSGDDAEIGAKKRQSSGKNEELGQNKKIEVKNSEEIQIHKLPKHLEETSKKGERTKSAAESLTGSTQMFLRKNTKKISQESKRRTQTVNSSPFKSLKSNCNHIFNSCPQINIISDSIASSCRKCVDQGWDSIPFDTLIDTHISANIGRPRSKTECLSFTSRENGLKDEHKRSRSKTVCGSQNISLNVKVEERHDHIRRCNSVNSLASVSTKIDFKPSLLNESGANLDQSIETVISCESHTKQDTPTKPTITDNICCENRCDCNLEIRIDSQITVKRRRYSLPTLSAREYHVTKVMCLIVVAYMVCWAPAAVVNFIELACPGAVQAEWKSAIVTLVEFKCLADPLIYGLGARGYRRAFQAFFRRICCQCFSHFV